MTENNENIKMTFQPKMQATVFGGDAVNGGDAGCLLSCDMRIFLEASGRCGLANSYKLKTGLYTGASNDVDSLFNSQIGGFSGTPFATPGQSTYLLSTSNWASANGGPAQAPWSGVGCQMLMGSLQHRLNIDSALEIRAGVNQGIQADESGKYNCGWYRCNNEYYGDGAELFANPFLFNKTTKGIQLNYSQGEFGIFAGYGQVVADALEVGVDGNGFGDLDRPNICDVGLCYNGTGCVPVKGALVCQRMTVPPLPGADSSADPVSVFGNEKTIYTLAAETAVATAADGDDNKLDIITAVAETEYSGIKFNGSCSTAKDAEVYKWSLGCLSKCQKVNLGCGIGGLGADAFGINVGAGAYAPEDGDDEIPLVCEASVLLNVCGFNVPFHVDYLSGLKGEPVQGNTPTETALICGFSPSRISALECNKDGASCSTIKILDCEVEGGLGEDDDEDDEEVLA